MVRGERNNRRGESGGMRIKSLQFGYVLLACIAGLWQAWCFDYGSNRLLVLVAIGMSLPFALVTYGYAALLRGGMSVAGRPDWRRMLILWAGMPLSLASFSLVSLAETGLMDAFGLGVVDLPLYNVRLVVGEGAACFVWATCLLLWSRQTGSSVPRNRLLVAFATLFVGVLLASGLAYVALRLFSRDYYVYLESEVTTVISAFVVILAGNNASESRRNLDLAADA